MPDKNEVPPAQPTTAQAQPTQQDLESVLFQSGGITMEDIKEHIGGPIVSVALHAVILLLMATVFATEPPPPPMAEITVQAQDAEVVKPPEDEMEELEELPEPMEITDMVVTDLQPMRSAPNRAMSTDVVALTENVATTATPLDVDITALTVTDSNSALKMSGLTAFGRAGTGSGKGRGGGMDALARATMLQGVFYDLKQTPQKKSTDLDCMRLGGDVPWNANPQLSNLFRYYCDVIGGFADSNWSRVMRNGNITYPYFQGKYFSPSIRLMNSCIYVPTINASEAPKAFHCEDDVKPSTWIAVYGGRVVAPETGKFRFVGGADDVLMVRFNGELVLDYGYVIPSLRVVNPSNELKRAITTHDYTGVDPEVVKRMKASPLFKEKLEIRTPEGNWLHGLCAGKTFSVEKGKVYDIDILISEVPGGHFQASLFIEKVDPHVEYEKDRNGCPILPLFWTSKAIPKRDTTIGGAMPFDRNGPVWRVRAARSTAKKTSDDDISL